MAVYFREIDTYFANVLSPSPYNGRRLMNLNGSFGKAILWFHPQDATLPNNRKQAGQDVFDMHYHMNSWDAVIDLLRNETPLHFNYSDTRNAAQIYTGDEPVDEEEAGLT